MDSRVVATIGSPAGGARKRERGAHSVWMARREVKVPLERLWILLSYRESRERFCRSWKASGRMQLILLAFKSLGAETGWEIREWQGLTLTQPAPSPSWPWTLAASGHPTLLSVSLSACYISELTQENAGAEGFLLPMILWGPHAYTGVF